MYRLLWMALMAVCLTSCDDKVDEADINLDDIFSPERIDDEHQSEDAMKVIGVKFTPN